MHPSRLHWAPLPEAAASGHLLMTPVTRAALRDALLRLAGVRGAAGGRGGGPAACARTATPSTSLVSLGRELPAGSPLVACSPPGEM